MPNNLLTTLRSEAMHRPVAKSWKQDPTARIESVLKAHKHGFQAGRILKLEGDHSLSTYCVLDGWLALTKSTKDGQRQIIDFVLPGDIMNPASADKTTSAMQIEVLSYAKVSVIPNTTWEKLKLDVPVLQARENRIIASAISRMAERMLRLGKGTAEMRIAYSLIELCLRLRAIGKADSDRFHVPLTQQQLGEFSGLSSVHVCRTMRRLLRQKILRADGQMDIVICDLDQLCEMAGIDLDALRSEIIPAQ